MAIVHFRLCCPQLICQILNGSHVLFKSTLEKKLNMCVLFGNEAWFSKGGKKHRCVEQYSLEEQDQTKKFW